MKKISIIIPVYNAMTAGGGFITRAVDSVLHQKDFAVEDIEILLINDGSKDNSLEVLQEIAQKNPKVVRLIDQKNMGVANTRNKAMKLATGEYTTFLDQDDWIDDDFFTTLYSAAIQVDADVVASGYRRPDSQGKITKTFYLGNTSYSRYTLSATWAKLHKTSFLKKNEIDFFDNSFGEDLPFSVQENITSGNYQTIDYIGYNWFFNEKSVSNGSQKSLTKNKINAIKKLILKLCENVPKKCQRDYFYFLLRTTIFYLLFSGREASRTDFIIAKEQFFKILSYKNDIFSRKNIHKLIIPPKGEFLNVGCIVSLFIIIDKLHLMSFFALLWCKKPNSIEK